MHNARNFTLGVLIDRQACKPKKCRSWPKGAWPRSRDLLLEFWDTIYKLMSIIGKVRDFKFGVRTDRQAYQQNNPKVSQKGVPYVT